MSFETAFVACTSIPNEILDTWLRSLSGNEFKVALYVVRRTDGFRAVGGKIRTQEVADATGLRKRDVRAAMRTLMLHARYHHVFRVDRVHPLRRPADA